MNVKNLRDAVQDSKALHRLPAPASPQPHTRSNGDDAPLLSATEKLPVLVLTKHANANRAPLPRF